MRCLLFVESSVAACLSLSPFVGFAASAGSGSQYEAAWFAVVFSEALGPDFLAVDGLRGLLTALCCTRVTFGAVFCNGPLRDGMELSRVERLSDMVYFSLGGSVQSHFV